MCDKLFFCLILTTYIKILQCQHWGCSVRFNLNEFKDSQFWFLDKNPGSDYGYIASNKYVPGQQEGRGGTRALSITGAIEGMLSHKSAHLIDFCFAPSDFVTNQIIKLVE